MKTFGTGMSAAASSVPSNLCWLLTLQARDGTGDTFRLTTNNEDVTRFANTWYADPGFISSSLRMSAGSQATIADITLACTDTTLITREMIINGKFKRAQGRLHIIDHKNPSTVVPLLMLRGYVGDIEYHDGDAMVRMEIGTRWRETRTAAIEKFGGGCPYQLGDSRCGVDLSESGDWNWPGIVTSVTSRKQFTIGSHGASLANGTNFFSNGALKFLTGDNANDAYDIRRWDNDVVYLWEPTGYMPVVGDTLRIHPGCDKTTGTNGCRRFYPDLAEFGGQPYLPPPDFTFDKV